MRLMQHIIMMKPVHSVVTIRGEAILRDQIYEKNMINLVVWIWQYQESETNKYREFRRQE